MLRKSGLEFESQRVETEQDFIRALDQFNPDLVLADYNLLNYDGLKALRELRKRNPLLPFMFVSGAMGEERVVDSLLQGADDYIIKDRLSRLPSAVRRVLDEVERKRTLKLAQQALLDSQEKYKALYDNAPVAYQSLNEQGELIDINPAWLSLLGYQRDEVIGKSLGEFLHPDSIGYFKTRFPQFKQEGVISNVQFQIRHKHGHYLDIEYEGRTTFFEDGRFAQTYCVFQDITERKLAEQALKQAYRVVENSPVVLFRWKGAAGWPVELVSNNVSQFGYAAEDLLAGRVDYQSMIHPDDLARVLSEVKVYLQQGITEFQQEYRIVARDGQIHWVDDRTQIEKSADGDIEYLQGLVIDITERKLIEQQLLKQAQAMEQSPESIVITNTDAEIEFVNEAFVQSTGYSREQALGQNPRILHSGRTPVETYRSMWASLQAGKPWKGEFCNRNSSGKEYFELAIIAPIRQPDGSITHYLAVKEDISEKKRAGRELDLHRYHLQELVEQRTLELEEARLKAETASRAKSSFLANMSHEIRTPMNAIIGLTHLMQKNHPTPEQRDRLVKIDSAANHLLSIINDILDISKIEAGKMQLEQSDFHLSGLFDHIKSMLRTQALDKGLTIGVDTNHVPLWLRGDPTRLRQALLNYASNAIKFTETGGISIRAVKNCRNRMKRFWCASKCRIVASVSHPPIRQTCSRYSGRPISRLLENTAAPGWGW